MDFYSEQVAPRHEAGTSTLSRMTDVDDVAKVRIVLVRGGERWYLMSRKRAPDKASNGSLSSWVAISRLESGPSTP